MSGGPKWMDLSEMSREGRLADIQRALSIGVGAEESGRAFQAACEAGQAGAARMLLPACAIEAVSRGMRKAAWRPSLACLLIAAERLDAEGWRSAHDVALALRDVKMEGAEGARCARELLARSRPGESAWAIREHLGEGAWMSAARLLAAGGSWDAPASSAMLSGRLDSPGADGDRARWPKEFNEGSPKEYWKRASRVAGEAVPGGATAPALARAERRAIEDALGRSELERLVDLAESGALPAWEPPVEARISRM